MKVGTKMAVGMTIMGGLLISLNSGHTSAIQVPKFEKETRAMEQKLNNEKILNQKLLKENQKLKEENRKIISYNSLLLQKLNKSKEQLKTKQKEIKKMSGFELTWYNDTGITKSGRQTVDGITISVDPSIIPLGTWVKIVFDNGKSIVRRADDTGSKVKGKVIDIYKRDSSKNLRKLGRNHNATVYILDK